MTASDPPVETAMFVRITAPISDAAQAEARLAQAAHVAGNLHLAHLRFADNAVEAQLKAYRPITDHVVARFVAAGTARFGSFSVDTYDTVEDARAAGLTEI